MGPGWAGQGLGLGQPQLPPAPVHLLCFVVWAVVGLAVWFQGGRCPDLPIQEYQAIQLGSYPCPGTQAGPPGVIGTESPTPHPPHPHSTAPNSEEPAWIRGPSPPSNNRPRKISIYQLPFLREMGRKESFLGKKSDPKTQMKWVHPKGDC